MLHELFSSNLNCSPFSDENDLNFILEREEDIQPQLVNPCWNMEGTDCQKFFQELTTKHDMSNIYHLRMSFHNLKPSVPAHDLAWAEQRAERQLKQLY